MSGLKKLCENFKFFYFEKLQALFACCFLKHSIADNFLYIKEQESFWQLSCSFSHIF